MNKANFFKKNLESFFSFLPVAICLIDSEGSLLEINKKMEDLSGYKKHELVDSKLSKIFKQEEAEEIMDKGVNGRELFIKGNEKKSPVNVYKKTIPGEDFFFLAFVDLSRAREIRSEMKEKVKEIERFNRLATGRELRMVELKRDKEKLKEKNKKLKKNIEKLRNELHNLKKDEQPRERK